jgi:hypothetical protein
LLCEDASGRNTWTARMKSFPPSDEDTLKQTDGFIEAGKLWDGHVECHHQPDL